MCLVYSMTYNLIPPLFCCSNCCSYINAGKVVLKIRRKKKISIMGDKEADFIKIKGSIKNKR